MGCREEFERVLAGQRFAFCLLVHTDVGSPMIDFPWMPLQCCRYTLYIHACCMRLHRSAGMLYMPCDRADLEESDYLQAVFTCGTHV